MNIGARNMRKSVLDRFTTVYKLKTLPTGAIVREWPAQFTVWNEDETKEGGYAMLQSFPVEPTRETVNELFDALETGEDKVESGNMVVSGLNEVMGFLKGLQKL